MFSSYCLDPWIETFYFKPKMDLEYLAIYRNYKSSHVCLKSESNPSICNRSSLTKQSMSTGHIRSYIKLSIVLQDVLFNKITILSNLLVFVIVNNFIHYTI